MGLILDNYTKKCKSTIGGVKNLYLLIYKEYSRVEVRDSAMNLTVFPDSYIYKFNCKGSYTQDSKNTKGANSFNQTISIKLSEVYNNLDINAFLNNKFRVIIETNNNDVLMFGAYNGMDCSATNGSGSNKNEFNGFDLQFKGEEQKAGLLISSLQDLGFTIVGNVDAGNFIFQDGNNFIFQDNNNFIY